MNKVMNFDRAATRSDSWILRCAAFSLTLGLSLSALAAPSKEDAIAAEILFKEANQLVEKGQCAAAIPKFEASERADHSNSTLYNLANAYECSGRITSAWKTFMTIVSAPTNGKRSSLQEDAEKRAEALEPRLPKLTVVVPESLAKTANLEVLVDDEPLPQSLWGLPTPVDPGVRKVTVKAPGKSTWSSQTRDLKEKDTERIEVSDLATPPFPKQRIVALAVGGVGVAAGIAAIVTGGLAKGYEADAWKACTGNKDPNPDACLEGSPSWFNGGRDANIKERPETLMNRALDYESAAIPLSIISGAAIGTAAILWFTASTTPKNDTAFRFVPYAAPGNAGATVHFTF